MRLCEINFLDEVYLGRSAAWTADLFGLERVEVLRGPQGTIYGRNVVGGAINLISINDYDETAKQFSQELRFSGSTDHLEWLLGAYYFHENTDRWEGFDLDVPLARDQIYSGGLGFTDQHNITDSHALFGQLRYAFDERWRLTGGARYSHDRKQLHQLGQAGGFMDPGGLRGSRRQELEPDHPAIRA